ncbi:MAG: MMPL family transporter [Bacteroidia bacterium]
MEMEKLVDSVRKDVDAIFDPEKYDVAITGTTQIFIKANDALIQNLLQSLVIAFLVIALMMGMLFRSLRMVAISLLPNVLPLIMVAGIMGFAGIALKPSTALVFGVAFGIAVDDSIHFLARYRLARRLGDTVSDAISNSFHDTGVSMIYTSVILFIGFVCFTASDFGGTQSLGLLTSLTLAIALFSNLLFLPSLLATFDRDDKPLFDSHV